MIPITRRIALDESERPKACLRLASGGQNVNKVETAVELRLDVGNPTCLTRSRPGWLLAGRRMTLTALIVTAQNTAQERNRAEALAKLVELIREAAKPPPPKRKPTKPTKGSQQRRMDSKAKRGAIKKMRGGKPGLD